MSDRADNRLPGAIPTLTRAEVRDLDRRAITELGISSLVLMENAGRGAADVLCSFGIAGPVAIACGKGNNGGDGFVVARHLALRGYAVRTLVFAEPNELSSDAAANANILARSKMHIDWLGESAAARSALDSLRTVEPKPAWIVDALLGTGATGDPREPIAGVIDQLNATAIPIFALDVPSGLDCDTGVASNPTIRAAHTCTFAAYKPGLLVPQAAPFVGRIHVADIGVLVGLLGAKKVG